MKLLITGGAGFIGANSAAYFSKKGIEVYIFDNLSRIGSDENLKWLDNHCSTDFIKGDIRDFKQIAGAIKKKGPFDLIIHLAAQVAVTTSVIRPRDDFEINALGTFNLLEAARKYNSDAVLIYASTNKVYGKMDDLMINTDNGRYTYQDLSCGVDETRHLDFHSPYGCSKGCADQYFTDYHRIYGLKTIVLRQSCIYGYRQFGIEDQGWVAWFCIASALGEKITIYGDGKQVRDILFVDDLVKAFECAHKKFEIVSGKALNIGGGPENTLSINELIELLENYTGRKISPEYDDWRPGDQKVFVSNISSARSELGWKPEIRPSVGVRRLYDWVSENTSLFESVLRKN
jgi:CDP-paratose 2-epimerase